jgi:hypothetical protein
MNQAFTCKYTFAELAIIPGDLERIMGYEPGNIPEPFCEVIDEVMANAENFASINGGILLFGKVKFDEVGKTLRIGKETFDLHGIVYHQLKKSEQIAVFACTAGPEIGALSRRLMAEGDMMKGYVADVLGSIIVETAMDKMQESFGLHVNKDGYKHTNRYSPGYCNWSVEDQHKLFSLLPPNFCGISLSDTALMNPIKSVSGIIGVGRDVKFNPYTCEICNMTTCTHKNLKKSGSK